MAVKAINSADFEAEVLRSAEPVVVDFWATWCGPCKMLSPVVEQVSETVSGVKFVKVDVDDNQDLAAGYNVASIPTLVLFKNGKEVNRSIGVIPKDRVEAFAKS